MPSAIDRRLAKPLGAAIAEGNCSSGLLSLPSVFQKREVMSKFFVCFAWHSSRRANAARMFVAIALIMHAPQAAFGKVTVTSPNKRNELRLDVLEGQLVYEVRRDGEVLFQTAPVRPLLDDAERLGTIVEITESGREQVDERWTLHWGKSNTLRDCHESIGVQVKCEGGSWEVDARAFDDGVAFRYRIPAIADGGTRLLHDEETEFRPAGAPRVLFNTLDSFQTSHESLYAFHALSSVPVRKLIDAPLLLVWPDAAAAITEGRVRSFAGMYLERATETSTSLRTRLSPRVDQENVAVATKGELESPWRVILLADRAGELLESNTLLSLNDPPLGDFDWVRPGKSTFHWWNGEFEEDFRSADLRKVFVTRHRKYIDFCAKHGIAYHGLSGDGRPWYPQSSPDYAAPSEDANVLVSRPELDLPAIFSYAKERGVGIRLWVHWKPLSGHLDEAFAEYESWGVTGLMVDFLDRDDQEMISFCEQVLEAAARHKLNIQFHGSSKNSGEQRTFPNLVNREGVLNLEYLKWSDLCTPDHSVNVAYTRALAGPVDYHHGGFRSVSRRQFKPVNLSPTVLGTRAHHMALYLVYENPLPMLADRPEHYEGQPGFDFLCALPTTWDETKFVAGEPGEYVVLARRKGNVWYLGGITNWTARTVEIPLRFLAGNGYIARLFVDGSQDEDRPNEILEEVQEVTSESAIRVSFAPGGGFLGEIRRP